MRTTLQYNCDRCKIGHFENPFSSFDYCNYCDIKYSHFDLKYLLKLENNNYFQWDLIKNKCYIITKDRNIEVRFIPISSSITKIEKLLVLI
jgi:hypothetical protein